MVGSDSSESLRDPFGNFHFILAGFNSDTLRSLSEILYTGQTTTIQTDKSHQTELRDNLKSLLSDGIELICSQEKVQVTPRQGRETLPEREVSGSQPQIPESSSKLVMFEFVATLLKFL